MQTEQLQFWSGMTDTEHSTTSSSNEEEDFFQFSSSLLSEYGRKICRLYINNENDR